MKNTISSLAIFLIAAGAGEAALITGVTVENVSGQNGGFNRLASYTLDGSGMSGLTPGVVGGASRQ